MHIIRIMGFYQLRLIGNGTDLESQLKTRIARYRAWDLCSDRSTPHMLRVRQREREREREREGERGGE